MALKRIRGTLGAYADLVGIPTRREVSVVAVWALIHHATANSYSWAL